MGTTSREEYENTRALIKILVRSREDFQDMRKRMDNRLGKKADGEDQDRERLPERTFTPDDVAMLDDVARNAEEQEKAVVKKLKTQLKKLDIYNDFLKGVKGVGEIAAAHIVAGIDIYKAETVSKIWQYCGLNPGMVRGKKRIEKGDTYEIEITDTMIRGDRLTPGFVAPFNKGLRVALRGVLADGFIKAKSSYALDYYYPYKARLEQSENTTADGPKKEQKSWKDVSKGHRDGAAKRYMVKMFLKDLYAAWRAIEGLPVREPYQEQYLGHVHSKAV